MINIDHYQLSKIADYYRTLSMEEQVKLKFLHGDPRYTMTYYSDGTYHLTFVDEKEETAFRLRFAEYL